jgi:ADP-ribose pyrophosphatase
MTTSGQRTLIHRGKRFDFELVRETLPDGRESSREVVRHPGAVVVLGLTDDQRIVLIRNHRVAVEDTLWELPAGTMEPPEPASVCAARELEEEGGFTASDVQPIAEFFTTPGMTDERMHAFLATGLAQSEQRLDDDERIEVHLKPVQTVFDMIEDGSLCDAKSMLALLIAARRGMIPTPTS